MADQAPPIDLTQYRTLIFDCDGVILNSNPIKTEAFYQAALPYGEDAARALRAYHVRNGGISRYHKFDWLLTEVVGQSEPDPEERQALLEAYAKNVWDGMLTCELDEAILELRKQTPHARWMVASGSDEQELREIFRLRGLNELFDAGIYGSPRTKEEIFSELGETNTLLRPAVFLGDSRYDAQAAQRASFTFIFVQRWSESEAAPSEQKIESCGDLVHSLGRTHL
nr:HAD family hydrolase [Halorhodospira halochloris]